MLLSDIRKGQRVEIVSLNSSEFKEKLMEMGCVPGVKVSLAMKAPLGDPVAFYIDGYCLSMRKKEAKSIEVKEVERV